MKPDSTRTAAQEAKDVKARQERVTLLDERNRLRADLADAQRVIAAVEHLCDTTTEVNLAWRVVRVKALRAALSAGGGGTTEGRPAVVCLCGSTRFYEAFQRANYEETMAGRIVLSVGFYPHAAEVMHGEGVGATPEQKAALDELHKRKIDLADEVLVLNVGGYIGESTRSEIDYAETHGKPVRYLEPAGGGGTTEGGSGE